MTVNSIDEKLSNLSEEDFIIILVKLAIIREDPQFTRVVDVDKLIKKMIDKIEQLPDPDKKRINTLSHLLANQIQAQDLVSAFRNMTGSFDSDTELLPEENLEILIDSLHEQILDSDMMEDLIDQVNEYSKNQQEEEENSLLDKSIEKLTEQEAYELNDSDEFTKLPGGPLQFDKNNQEGQRTKKRKRQRDD